MKSSLPLEQPRNNPSAALQPFKLRVLKLLLLLTGVSILAVWTLERFTGLIIQIDNIAYPILAMLSFVSLIALSIWPRLLNIAEWISFISFSAYMIAQILSTAFGLQRDTSLYSITSLAQWFPLIYIAAFIFFNTRQAISLSIAIYLLFLLPILAQFALGNTTLLRSDSYPIMLNIFWAHPVYILTLTSVTQLKRHYIEAKTDATVMSVAANIDYLTGVANRRAASQALQSSIIATHSGQSLAVLLIDIDHFKHVNDHFGHDIGDQVLSDLATSLREQLRSNDILGRWGGEEFIIIAQHIRMTEASQLAERLRAHVARRTAEQKVPITLSFGVSSARPGDTPESLVKRADEALYRAKQSGRNRVELEI